MTVAVRGGLWSIALAFPFAALCGLLYRFPIPLAGYASGPGAVPGALMAVLFYGILGGFVVLFAGGAVGGLIAHAIAQPSLKRVRRLTVGLAATVTLTCVALLAVLDQLIGAW